MKEVSQKLIPPVSTEDSVDNRIADPVFNHLLFSTADEELVLRKERRHMAARCEIKIKADRKLASKDGFTFMKPSNQANKLLRDVTSVMSIYYHEEASQAEMNCSNS